MNRIIYLAFLCLLSACNATYSPVANSDSVLISDTIIEINNHLPKVDTNVNNKTSLGSDSVIEQLTTVEFLKQKVQIEYQRFSNIDKHAFNKLDLQYPGFIMKPAEFYPQIIPLKNKLKLLGFYQADSITHIFDEALTLAIKDFQQMHGLTSDGVPGRNTYIFLGWRIDDYLYRLEYYKKEIVKENNNENLRIEVNIPSAQLTLIEGDSVIFSSRVVVGKFKTQTPVYQSKIDYLVFNPCWTVPNSIATKNFLPKLKRDSLYLQKHNMFVTLNGIEQPDSLVDFSLCTKDNFPYKIFQRSGAGNALGQVKFMFDNPYHIYLHDTPQKYLYAKDFRTFSNGCIRVENALELAKVLLKQMNKNSSAVNYYLQKGYPVKAFLKKPIPIIISYTTCKYHAELKRIQFFKDVYYKLN